MSKIKVKWKVCEVSTGPYRSFSRRGWPMAHYSNEHESLAATISCDDEYIPAKAKVGDHRPLTLRIADYSQFSSEKGLPMVVAKTKPATMKEAKELLLKILQQHPHLIPKDKQDEKNS